MVDLSMAMLNNQMVLTYWPRENHDKPGALNTKKTSSEVFNTTTTYPSQHQCLMVLLNVNTRNLAYVRQYARMSEYLSDRIGIWVSFWLLLDSAVNHNTSKR